MFGLYRLFPSLPSLIYLTNLTPVYSSTKSSGWRLADMQLVIMSGVM